MSSRPTLPDLFSAISLPGLADGATPCDLLAGETAEPVGQEVVPVSHSRQRGAAMRPPIRAIFGLRGSASLRSSALQSSLVSRLRARMAGRGSISFATTWKRVATPSGRLIYRLAASALTTSDSGSGSWPTPTLDDSAGRQLGNPHLTRFGTWRHRNRKGSQSLARLAQVCNHLGRPDLAASGEIPRMDDGVSRWVVNGFGNAVVPYVGAEVIAAYMEIADV